MDAPRLDKLDPLLAKLDGILAAMQPLAASRCGTIERWRADAEAARFHQRFPLRANDRPLIVAVVGGTGTGKSTLVNRLVGANVTAASFRRTFTSGPVAIVRSREDLPSDWLRIEHVSADPAALPLAGKAGALIVVDLSSLPPSSLSTQNSELRTSLIDTPDLDGDQPAHHAQADRAFRWAQGVLFAVTPEKYQMTELQPYYRLAARYGVPALHVMNKCEEAAVAADFERQVRERGSEGEGERGRSVFVVARDDAGYEPPADRNLDALRSALSSLAIPDDAWRTRGLRNRATDLLGRLNDQVIAPLRADRGDADRLIASLRAMETPAAGIDVNPLTQQLRRRLQQRSILYLMSPGRLMDRVRQAPTLLARLPRATWDYFRTGQVSAEIADPAGVSGEAGVPDFRAALSDGFAVLQSRIDDAIRESAAGARWIGEEEKREAASGYSAARIDPANAGRIAEEELAELKAWLEKRWNATPRDTRMIESLLKHLPGGRRVAKWTEAAPYLLTVVLVTHGAFFGHLDLMVLGGYGIATWLTERLSNEVAGRTRATNARIEQRFATLAHNQIEQLCAWIDRQAPSRSALAQLERAGGEMGDLLG